MSVISVSSQEQKFHSSVEILSGENSIHLKCPHWNGNSIYYMSYTYINTLTLGEKFTPKNYEELLLPLEHQFHHFQKSLCKKHGAKHGNMFGMKPSSMTKASKAAECCQSLKEPKHNRDSKE